MDFSKVKWITIPERPEGLVKLVHADGQLHWDVKNNCDHIDPFSGSSAWVYTGGSSSCTSSTSRYKCSICDDTKTTHGSGTGHSYTVKSNPGTCTIESNKVYTCTKCGHSYTEYGEINPSIHTGPYHEEGDVVNGNGYQVCEACGNRV